MQNSADSAVSSSLELLGQQEEADWRDTVQLHREEVIFVFLVIFIYYEIMSTP